jgi:ethanolamine utilization protein EutN
MIIARILGTVVATQKDERLSGKKLLIVRPVNVDGSDTTGYVVAVDTVGAGFHERVLVVAGSSARLAQGMKDVPVDAAIVGVIDTVELCTWYLVESGTKNKYKAPNKCNSRASSAQW